MKRIVRGVAAISVVIVAVTAISIMGSSAFASTKKKPVPVPPPPPVFSWTGFYVGGNIGYGWGFSTNPSLSFTPGCGCPDLGGYFGAGGNGLAAVAPSGVLGGGQISFNWLIYPRLLGGLIADIQGSGIRGSATATLAPGIPPGYLTNSEQIDWFGTLRAKVGLIQDGPWLPYVTGGLAYGGVRTSGSFIAGFGDAFFGSDNTTKVGWAIGAGVNYVFMPNWIVGVEYLFVDLGNTSYTETQPGTEGASITINNHTAVNVFRVLLDYKL